MIDSRKHNKDDYKEDEIAITPKMIIAVLVVIVIFLALIASKTNNKLEAKVSEVKEKIAEIAEIKETRAIEIEASEINIDAIIQIESAGDQFAISYKGIKHGAGIAQISSICHKEYLDHNPTEILPERGLFDKDYNIKIAKWYFDRIKNHYLKGKGTIDDCLICYNWGYGNWRKWNMAGRDYKRLPKETLNYLSLYEKIKREE